MKPLPYILLLALLWLGTTVPTAAQTTDLASLLAQAQDGEVIELPSGIYTGSFVIEKSITLIGEGWPVLDGDGRGHVLVINAPDVRVEGFIIRNSGTSLDQESTGILANAPRATILNNRLENVLFGIGLHHAEGSIVRDNTVVGMTQLEVARRGDSIRVWYSNDVVLEGNRVMHGRDVVLWYSSNLILRGNEITDSRYGLHFMFCDDALITENLLYHNSVGAFLMYSQRLTVERNTIASNRGPSGFGLGLKEMDDAVVVDNLFLDNRVGAHLDGTPMAVGSVGIFSGNVFGYNDIGLALLPSVRHNQFSGNSFVENQEQVAIQGGGAMAQNEWSVNGRGNYWSDYAGFDADGDGRGDIPYRAERLFETLLENNPELRLFVYSPSANAVDFAAKAFPIVRPQAKLIDDFPLMQPVVPTGTPILPAPPQSHAVWVLAFLLIASAALINWPWLKPISPKTQGNPLYPNPFGVSSK